MSKTSQISEKKLVVLSGKNLRKLVVKRKETMIKLRSCLSIKEKILNIPKLQRI